MQTLLRTGFGLRTTAYHFETLSANHIKGLLRNKGFIIVNGLNYNRDKLLELSNQYGTLLEYLNEKKKIVYGNKYIFDVDGSDNKKVRGRWEDDGNEDTIERTEDVKKKDRNEEDRRKRKLGVGRRHKKIFLLPTKDYGFITIIFTVRRQVKWQSICTR